jgi:hypothetical protein
MGNTIPRYVEKLTIYPQVELWQNKTSNDLTVSVFHWVMVE